MATIDEHLLRDENILASAKGVSSSRLYATNKRVIRHEKQLFGEKVDSLFYNHIASCALDNRSYGWLAILGALLLLWGLSESIGFILVTGVLLLLFGIFHRESWYRITPMDLADKNGMWRTHSTDEDAKTFARFIQDQISARELSGGRKEEAVPSLPAAAPQQQQQRQAGDNDDASADEDNLKLLKKRLAQGKITEKEYKKLKKVLEK